MCVTGLSYNRYRWTNMLRDTAKAYAGFSVSTQHTAVATGNWGCGTFESTEPHTLSLSLSSSSSSSSVALPSHYAGIERQQANYTYHM